MHIAYLTSEYPLSDGNAYGGLATSIKGLATNLTNSEHNVSIFLIDQKEELSFIEEDIKIYKLKNPSYKCFNWYLKRKHYQRQISDFIESENIHLIETADWTGIAAFMNFPVPLVVRLHGSDAYFSHLAQRKQKRKNRFLEKLNLKNADFIISVSNYTAGVTKQLFLIEKDIITIHNGIDTKIFKKIEVKVNADSILYFGSIIRKKGVLELAHAFNEVIKVKPTAQLYFLGKDVIDIKEQVSTTTLIKSILSETALKATIFKSAIPYDEVKNHIASATVICLPSFAEAFPMTWLEAMAMEKALVTSDIGWANEMMIDEVTGYMINPLDHNHFASRILDLLHNEKLRARLGQAARRRVVNHFSSNQIIQHNISFYSSICNI